MWKKEALNWILRKNKQLLTEIAKTITYSTTKTFNFSKNKLHGLKQRRKQLVAFTKHGNINR